MASQSVETQEVIAVRHFLRVQNTLVKPAGAREALTPRCWQDLVRHRDTVKENESAGRWWDVADSLATILALGWRGWQQSRHGRFWRINQMEARCVSRFVDEQPTREKVATRQVERRRGCKGRAGQIARGAVGVRGVQAAVARLARTVRVEEDGQLAQLDWPADAWKVPASHAAHASPPGDHLPAAQSLQAVPSVGEDWPAAQFTQLDWPVAAWKVPATQPAQFVGVAAE